MLAPSSFSIWSKILTPFTRGGGQMSTKSGWSGGPRQSPSRKHTHSPSLSLPPSIPLVPSLALLLLEATHFPPPRTPSFRGLPQSRRFRRRRQDEQGGAHHVANFGRHRDKLKKGQFVIINIFNCIRIEFRQTAIPFLPRSRVHFAADVRINFSLENIYRHLAPQNAHRKVSLFCSI